LVLILIRLMPLVIAILTGFGIVLMSIVVENNAYAQWIMPWELNDAYKQQQHINTWYIKHSNSRGTTKIIHQFIKPEK
jgi:hypothetical protein